MKSPLSSCMCVGVTGLIGAGKSTVVEALNQRGIASIDCDTVAKNFLFDEKVQRKLARILGKKCFPQGKPDTKKITSIIFKNSAKRKAMEAVIHPLVWQKVQEVASVVQGILLVESPFFCSTWSSLELNYLVIVCCNKDLRMKRLVRRGMSKKDAQQRNALQEKMLGMRHSDFVVNTDSTKKDEEIESLYKKLCDRYYFFQPG